MKTFGTILLFIIFAFSSCTAYSQKPKVIKISDGDSFTVLYPDKHTERIRLHGIDCPERDQPFSKAAKKFTSQLVFNKEVNLVKRSTDRYSRTVALVYLKDSILLNTDLLKAGLAWHFTRYDKNLEWQKLEEEARKNRKGLWADTQEPVAPWLWRKNKNH
ncbi:MAG: thermonuclease family protein [Sphingobacteriales bacterium]|nr:thermonuclease family protein [Sphingobacteriales bacterium]